MILTPDTPGAGQARVIDTRTGNPVPRCCRVDTKKRRAWVYKVDRESGELLQVGGCLVEEPWPNPVRVEGLPTLYRRPQTIAVGARVELPGRPFKHEAPALCQGKSRHGARCALHAQPGTSFCRRHQPR